MGILVGGLLATQSLHNFDNYMLKDVASVFSIISRKFGVNVQDIARDVSTMFDQE